MDVIYERMHCRTLYNPVLQKAIKMSRITPPREKCRRNCSGCGNGIEKSQRYIAIFIRNMRIHLLIIEPSHFDKAKKIFGTSISRRSYGGSSEFGGRSSSYACVALVYREGILVSKK